MGANRWMVAGLFSFAVVVAIFVLEWSGVVGIAAAGPATLLLSVLVAGNLTLASITITSNQPSLPRVRNAARAQPA